MAEQTLLESLLRDSFPDASELAVEDRTGGGDHFQVTIASARFDGLSLRALRAAGAPVTAVDILPDPRIRQELSALSGWPTIPQVFIKGELIGGADIVEELHASGELERKLDEALGTEREAGERTAVLA